MNQNTTSSLGRAPLWDAAKAREILDTRRVAFEGVRMTTEQFIEQLVQGGVIPFPCSVASMQRLLNGRMFPSLKEVDDAGVETGKLYDYSKVPKSPRGHPPSEERVDRETGKTLPVFTKRQKEWEVHITQKMERVALNSGANAARQEIRALQERLGVLLLEMQKLTDRVAALEISKTQ